ncbi:MAG: hypothetical protein ACLFRK_02665 [Candidatus Nanohaloarchaea archaeon]
MDKLLGLTFSLLTVITGSYSFIIGFPAAASSGLIIAGIGLTIFFERKVIKESNSLLEKTLSSLIPVFTEAAIVLAVIFETGYILEASVYLVAVLVLSDSLNRLESLFDVNTSRLTGRISRVLILSIGLAASQLNPYLVFYSLAGATAVTGYDLAVLLDETRSSI